MRWDRAKACSAAGLTETVRPWRATATTSSIPRPVVPISTGSTMSGDHDHHIAGCHRITRRHPDLADGTGRLGGDVVLHLHGFQHGDRLPGLDRVTDRDE